MSLYDTNPVYLMSVACEEITWLKKDHKLFDKMQQKMVAAPFYWVLSNSLRSFLRKFISSKATLIIYIGFVSCSDIDITPGAFASPTSYATLRFPHVCARSSFLVTSNGLIYLGIPPPLFIVMPSIIICFLQRYEDLNKAWYSIYEYGYEITNNKTYLHIFVDM